MRSDTDRETNQALCQRRRRRLAAVVSLAAFAAVWAATPWGSWRLAAALVCCLLLVRWEPNRSAVPALAGALIAVGLLTPLPDGRLLDWTGVLLIARNVAACVLVTAVFRVAATVRGLGRWQAVAVAGTWFLLGGAAHGAAGVLLLAVVIMCAALSHIAGRRDEDLSLNTFLGTTVVVLAIGEAGASRASPVFWLLPLLPLILDVAAGAVSRLFKPGQALPSMPVCERLAATGGPDVPARVVLATGLGWCGMVAWWGHVYTSTSLVVAVMAAAPLAFAILVVLVASSKPSARSSTPVNGSPTAIPARILGLDGLRAFAVVLVVLSPAGLMEGDFWQRTGMVRLLNAQVGVQIFFVLSGVLITHLLLEEHSRWGRVNFSAFYLRRLLRIFPVYYASIAVSFALAAATVYPIRTEAFAAAVAYVVNFAPWDAMEASFSHFWSLAVEEHFYFLWPLAIAASRGRVRATATIAAAAILFMCWWQLYPPGWLVALSSSHAINRWTIPAALPILVGCLTAVLLRQRCPGPTATRVCGISGVLIFLLPSLPSVWALVPEPLGMLVSSLGIAAVIAFLVWRQDSLAVKLLEARPLVYLGTISYGIYVWQGILTGNGPYRQVPGWPPDPVAGAVAAVLVAAVSYHFFEKPVLAWKNRLAGREGG